MLGGSSLKKGEAFASSQSPLLYERNATLDIVRGFSLFGILLVNVIAFYTPLPHVMLEFWFTNVNDIIWHQYLSMYVQSSFYPLFALLFGYGLAMQFLKAETLGRSFYSFAPKRMLAIFIIGLIHAFLIWWGDILIMYAFCGLFLIGLMRFKPFILLIIAFVLNGAFHLFYGGGLMLMGAFHLKIERPALDILTIQNAITAYGTGSWMEAFRQRLVDLAVQFDTTMWFVSLVTILPYMLVGATLAKWRLIERGNELKWRWLLLAVVFVVAGLAIKTLPVQLENTYGFSYLNVYVGGPMLAFGYLAAIVVICLVTPIKKLLSPLAKAGRMSLTLYIMQSVICSLLFYNFGFGLFGKVDVLTGILIAVGIFAVQLAIAELWLWKFKQGPLEWLVKKFVYGKMLS